MAKNYIIYQLWHYVPMQSWHDLPMLALFIISDAGNARAGDADRDGRWELPPQVHRRRQGHQDGEEQRVLREVGK